MCIFPPSCASIVQTDADGLDRAVFEGDNPTDIIAEGKYYRVSKSEEFNYSYVIFNSRGEIVETQYTGHKLPDIKTDFDEILDIQLNFGTGLASHQYYSIKQDSFSRMFWYVVAHSNDLVAYIYVSKEDVMNGRCLIIQNTFNKELYYKEFYLDFAEIDTPILRASFSEDLAQLEIIYLSKEGMDEVSETIQID